MEVPLSASLQDNGEEPVSSLPGETLDVAFDQKTIKDDTGAGSSSEELLTQELEDLSRKEVHPLVPDQKEMVLLKEEIGSALDRDATKKKAELSEAGHETQKSKIYSETGSTLVPTDGETSKEKELELGETKMKDGAGVVVKSEEERKGEDASTSREGDKEETKTRTGLNDEEKDLVVEGSIQSKVDARQGEKQKNMESSVKNLGKGEEGKKEQPEKSVDSISGLPDAAKKGDKKEKKSRNSTERILKKLEKINAKIGRILAKKEEYEVRLKDAQERERQESKKAAAHDREVSMAVVEKPDGDCNGPGMTIEGPVEGSGLRLDHDASVKESNSTSAERGFSGSLSRTASLIEVTSEELMKEVALPKSLAKKLANVLVSDGKEINPPLPTKDSDPVMKGQEKIRKHALHVDDSNDTGPL